MSCNWDETEGALVYPKYNIMITNTQNPGGHKTRSSLQYKPVLLLILFFLLLSIVALKAQNVGINTTGTAPNSSAILDLNTGNNFVANPQGFLVPVMNTISMNAIVSPATGLMIFNTDCEEYYYWSSAVWIPFPGNGGSITTPGAITGNSTACPLPYTGTYSISAVAGATGYNWSVPSGVTITSGQGTTSINISCSTALTGNICVFAIGSCGISAPSCLAVTFQNGTHGSITYSYTGGSQTWTVPCAVTTFTVVLKGASGGYGASFPIITGYGAQVQTTISGVTAGQVIQVNVGGAGGQNVTGWNGGGPGGYSSAFDDGGGGGMSDIRVSPYVFPGNMLAVAGGGGGTGGGFAHGGGNGGTSGQNGTAGGGGGSAGGGGAGLVGSGGAGGGSANGGGSGSAGTPGQGGSGGSAFGTGTPTGGGGGGGGGYYGGGGGGSDGTGYSGGGGGGSSYSSGSATTYSTLAASGNGTITITW